MSQDDSEIDESVEWLSMEMPIEPRKPPHSLWSYLAVAGALLLGLLTLVIAARQLLQTTETIDVKVSSHGLTFSPELQAESVKALQEFDATSDSYTELTAQQQQERQAILTYFKQLEACAQKGAAAEQEEVSAQESALEEFQQLVDYDRLLKRLELTGRIVQYSPREMKYLRSELKKYIEIESHWAQIVIARILTPEDDPSTRIVYAFCRTPGEDDLTEMRFFLGRDGKAWKLYDWERLDLGMCIAQEWAIYAQYSGTTLMSAYERWAVEVAEVDALIVAGDIDEAKAKIQIAETEMVPPELEDRCRLLTAYRWMALGDNTEAIRCFQSIGQPAAIPGNYYGLMNCFRISDMKQSLEYANLYEQCVGPTIDLLNIKASIYDQMHLGKKALGEWKKILRIEPENEAALREVLLALPKDDKSGFKPFVANLTKPVETLVTLAENVSWQDYEGLRFLQTELAQFAPQSAATYYLEGLVKSSNGQFQEAADWFRQAFESESEHELIDKYAYAYLEARSILGQGVTAWKEIPDQESLYESLAYNYQDEEIALTSDEFHHITELYQQKVPGSLEVVAHLASLAIEEHRYEEAQQILHRGLAAAEILTNAEETPYDTSNLSTMLAGVLYKLGRLEEAYQIGADRPQRFAQLCQLAQLEENYDVMRELIDLHRKLEPDDPFIHLYQAELATQKKNWVVALEELQAGVDAVPQEQDWNFKYRLEQAYVDSGRWPEYYADSEDQKELFTSLSRSFISDKKWESFSALVAAHRLLWPDDPAIMRQLAEAAWERSDFADYIQYAKHICSSDDFDNLYEYERELTDDRLISALLRTHSLAEARELAVELQTTQFRSAPLAIVNAASKKYFDAEFMALQAASETEGASLLYLNDVAGSTFLGNHFEKLHKEYPVEPLLGIAPTSVVFLSQQPWQLSSVAIQQALNTSDSVKPLKSNRPEVSASFSVSLDGGSLWIVAGTNKFKPAWQLEHQTGPLRKKASQCPYWLAMGTAAWTKHVRKQLELRLRSLAAKLHERQAQAFCIRESKPWEEFRIYPATPALITLWELTGDLQSSYNEGKPLRLSTRNRNLAEDRHFEAGLRKVARAWDVAPENQLKLWACFSPNAGVCNVAVAAKTMKNRYGKQVFVGRLMESSQLIPELREGLNILVNYDQIDAWQLNSDPPVFRSP